MPRTKALVTLSDPMKQAVQLLVLDRWKTADISKHVCRTVGIDSHTLSRWRRSKVFRDEFQRQLELFRANFDDIQMADRKERVMALDQLYKQIPDRQVSLKVKVLSAIRTEVGDDKAVQHEHKHQIVETQQGPKIPPRAQSYQEWATQNQIAQKAVDAEHEVVQADEGEAENLIEKQIEEEDHGEGTFEDPLAFLSVGSGSAGRDNSGEFQQPPSNGTWEEDKGTS